MNKKHLKLVKVELARAKEKHPEVCPVLFFSMCMEEQLVLLHHFRAELKILDDAGMQCYELVLLCEIMEAKEAFLLNNNPHMKQELAQCAAVLFRMMEKAEQDSPRYRIPFKRILKWLFFLFAVYVLGYTYGACEVLTGVFLFACIKLVSREYTSK